MTKPLDATSPTGNLGTKPTAERPIIFQGWGVVAIRENRKTQTRRTKGLEPINKSPNDWEFIGQNGRMFQFRCKIPPFMMIDLLCLYGVPGDRLWVRETWAEFYASSRNGKHESGVRYRADNAERIIAVDSMRFGGDLKLSGGLKWAPSIYMPRWASRLFLEITEVWVQRVQETSEGDAQREGWAFEGLDLNQSYDPVTMDTARQWYRSVWDSLNAKRGLGWDVNPWVWALAFRRVSAA